MRDVKIDHYLPKLKEMYPDLDEKIIKKIIKEGCKSIAINCMNHDPILVESPKKGVKFLIHNTIKSAKDNKQ